MNRTISTSKYTVNYTVDIYIVHIKNKNKCYVYYETTLFSGIAGVELLGPVPCCACAARCCSILFNASSKLLVLLLREPVILL